MPPRGYEFMSELDGELFFRGREDHICDYHSKLGNFPAGGNEREKKASNVLMLENIKTKVYCSKVFLPITYHLLMIHFFSFLFPRNSSNNCFEKKIADLPPYFKIINP